MKRDVEEEEATYANIYIPKAADSPSIRIGASDLVRGSAIVGLPDKPGLVWYEGHIYGAVNLKRYAERVRHAAGRAFTKSYSAFTGGFNAEDFHQIGTISRDYAIFLDTEMDEIAQWTTETPAEIRQENKDFLATRAYNSGDAHKLRRLHSCLTCAGTQELQKEKTSHRIFCNTDCQRVFYVSNRLINLNVGPDEAGPKINDSDTIGIITTGFKPGSESRKFRISIDEAKQMTTISNWLDADKTHIDNYKEIPIDGLGFAMLIDALRGNFPADQIRKLNDDDLYSLANSAAYTAADTFLWSTLLSILGKHLLLTITIDAGSFTSDGVFKGYLDAKTRNSINKFLQNMKPLILDIIYTFSAVDLKKFVQLLDEIHIDTISFPFETKPAQYNNDGIDFELDLNNLDYYNNVWNVISAASIGNLTLLKHLQTYIFDWTMEFASISTIWTRALIAAIKNTKYDMVQYLVLEDQRTANVILFDNVFSRVMRSINAQILNLLLQNPRIDVNVKYQTLVAQMHNISLALVQLILSDKRIDPSFNNQEIFKAAIEHLRYEIIQVLLQDKRVNPGADNDFALRTVVAKISSMSSATKLAVMLIKDDRVNPSMIPERYKNPAIIDALRERYTQDAAAEAPEKKQRVNFRLY